MSFFNQLRKDPSNSTLLKELAEKLERYYAEQGIEDFVAIRQMRVDTDSVAYTDTDDNNLDGDLSDTDTVAYTDAEDNSLQTSGAFQICDEDGTGTDNTQPGLIHFSDIGNSRGTGDSV